MVLDKKKQKEYLELVKDFETLDKFGAFFYYLYNEGSLVIEYQKINKEALIVYDVEEKVFKECLKRDLFPLSVKTYEGIKIKAACNTLWVLREEFRSNIYKGLHNLLKTKKTSSISTKINHETIYDKLSDIEEVKKYDGLRQRPLTTDQRIATPDDYTSRTVFENTVII